MKKQRNYNLLSQPSLFKLSLKQQVFKLAWEVAREIGGYVVGNIKRYFKEGLAVANYRLRSNVQPAYCHASQTEMF